MLIKDIMTKDVVTIPGKTSLGEAKNIMKERKFRRLPVVDKGKLVGIVTEDRLERVTPSSTAPLLWQVSYLVSRTRVKDIMNKNVVAVEPEATVEQGVTVAQSHKVGALVVVKEKKLVGIVTTNDFFYNVVNPVLGIGESGTRIIVPGCGDGISAEKVIARINKLGMGIKVLWATASPATKTNDLIIHLDTEDASKIITELQNLGFQASIRPR